MAVLTVLHSLVVLDPRPQQPARQALWYTRPDAKVQVWLIRPPEQAVIAGLLDLRDLRIGERQLRLQREEACQACPEAGMPGVAWHVLYHLLFRGKE